MKKHYAILGICGGLFVLCLAVLFFNPDSHRLLTYHSILGPDITTTPVGDTLLIILGILVLIAIVITIIYRIYRFISKITGKKNETDFIPDADEFYTKKQSSENISAWLISTHGGHLEDDDKNKNNKGK